MSDSSAVAVGTGCTLKSLLSIFVDEIEDKSQIQENQLEGKRMVKEEEEVVRGPLVDN